MPLSNSMWPLARAAPSAASAPASAGSPEAASWSAAPAWRPVPHRPQLAAERDAGRQAFGDGRLGARLLLGRRDAPAQDDRAASIVTSGVVTPPSAGRIAWSAPCQSPTRVDGHLVRDRPAGEGGAEAGKHARPYRLVRHAPADDEAAGPSVRRNRPANGASAEAPARTVSPSRTTRTPGTPSAAATAARGPPRSRPSAERHVASVDPRRDVGEAGRRGGRARLRSASRAGAWSATHPAVSRAGRRCRGARSGGGTCGSGPGV